MAISYVQAVASTWPATFTSTHVVTFSATPTSGNFLFAFMHVDRSASVAWTAPVGWTDIGWPSFASSVDPVYLQGMYKISDGTETGFTVTTAASVRVGWVVAELSGVDSTTPVVSNAAYMDPLHSSFLFDMGAFAASADTSYVLRGSACNDDGDGGTFDFTSAPTGHTTLNYVENTTYGGLWVTGVSPYTAGDSVANQQILTESVDGGEVDAVETGSVGLKAAGGGGGGGSSALSAAYLANAIRLQPNYKR
jgi:hypothetical protein